MNIWVWERFQRGPSLLFAPGPAKPLCGPDLTHDRLRHSAPAVGLGPYLGIWGLLFNPGLFT